MGKYLDRAKEVRAIETPHYNCAQGVLVAFAERCGIDEDTAYRVGANFGKGMKMGATCGAVTGGLMVLGLLGIDAGSDLVSAVRKQHDGMLECKDLLRACTLAGTPRKQHCDGMVFEVVRYIEELLGED